MKSKRTPANSAHLADMMAAMGNEQRLNVMRMLLFSHPGGMVVGDIQSALGVPNSTLSHHLEKLRIVGLVNVKRESQFLRYTANTRALQELLSFLFAECCTGSTAVKPETLISLCK